VTLELESLSLPVSPERAVARAEGEPATPPWSRAPAYWEELEPRGSYARRWRGPFLLGVALVLLLPALFLALPIALRNRREHGSWKRVLFRQARVGRRGRVFPLYKFRTMSDRPGTDHARVTPFGRFLRNTHLDELPQLLNVLRGEMCLIGPRPEMVATERWAARRCPAFCERLVLAPGLTGHAQITQGYTEGGDEAAYLRKLELNRAYRESLSFRGDLAILVRTTLWMLRARGWRTAPRRDLSSEPAG